MYNFKWQLELNIIYSGSPVAKVTQQPMPKTLSGNAIFDIGSEFLLNTVQFY